MKIIIFTLSVFAMFFMSGCVKPDFQVPNDIKIDRYRVSVDELGNNVLELSTSGLPFFGKNDPYTYLTKNSSYAVLAMFKKYSEISNKPYFMVLNPNASNLEGFPINNLPHFSRFVGVNPSGGYFKREIMYFHKDQKSISNDYVLYILPLDEEDENFSTWSASELKEYFELYFSTPES